MSRDCRTIHAKRLEWERDQDAAVKRARAEQIVERERQEARRDPRQVDIADVLARFNTEFPESKL